MCLASYMVLDAFPIILSAVMLSKYMKKDLCDHLAYLCKGRH